MSAAPILNFFRDGAQIGSTPIEGDVILGREAGCVIRLDDRAISRQHAVFRAVSGGVQVERKSQFAPLSVNGAECTRAVVKEGDVITIGPFQLKLAPMDAGFQASADQTVALQPIEAGAELKFENVSNQAAPLGFELTLIKEGDEPLPSIANPNATEGLPGTILEAVENDIALEIGEGEGGQIVLDPPAEQIGENEETRLAPAAQMIAVVSIEPGGANITEIQLGDAEISIGRGKECDIVLTTKKASRKHSVIRREGPRFIVQDLDSANGTYVNGRRVREMDLTGDDEIRIGGTRIHFKVQNPEYQKSVAEFMKVETSGADTGVSFSNDADTKPLSMDSGENSVRKSSTASGLNIPIYSGPPVGFRNSNTRLNLMGLPGQTANGSGIPGLQPMKAPPKGFLERYRNMPPKQKMIWTVFILVFVWWFLFDDELEVAPKVAPKVVAPSGQAESQTADGKFRKLSEKDKAFIEAEHQLAFDHLKNKDYDLCLHELDKIFAMVDNYKDSRELERYAREGKRRRDAIEEEKKKREEEARLKAHVSQLVDEATDRMKKKQYEQASQLFYEILSIEPDNLKVTDWKRQIEAWEEEKARAETEKLVQRQINERALQQLEEGLALRKAGKCRDAIPILAAVEDIGATDKSALKRANAAIQGCRSSVIAKRDPLLAEAKQLEAAGELKRAFNLYRDATRVDPDHPAGFQGMGRIRSVLRERSRLSYAEGVMAESYSDFVTARLKFNEVLSIAPEDDLYHDRAKRKLSGYLSRELAAEPATDRAPQ